MVSKPAKTLQGGCYRTETKEEGVPPSTTALGWLYHQICLLGNSDDQISNVISGGRK
jgi:hypothetical protein